MTDSPLNRMVTVVVRSANERTNGLCQKLIIEQGISSENIETIRVYPFSEALRKSFNVGIEVGRKWLLCVDADVLLRGNSINKLIDFAELQSAKTCEVQGGILDKFFGGARAGGIHLYRTSLLPTALNCIPTEKDTLRPESVTLARMAEMGFPWVEIPYVVGLHDFEQFYHDIYRKCFVHAHKHLKFAELFVGVWKKDALIDSDFRVAMSGFCDGLRFDGSIAIDKSASYFETNLSSLQLREKNAIELKEWNVRSIDDILERWQEPVTYKKYYPKWTGLVKHASPVGPSPFNSFGDLRNRVGLRRAVAKCVGQFIERFGTRIQNMGNTEVNS